MSVAAATLTPPAVDETPAIALAPRAWADTRWVGQVSGQVTTPDVLAGAWVSPEARCAVGRAYAAACADLAQATLGGLPLRLAHGWPLQRIARASGVPVHVLRRYIERGELAVVAGATCTYIDPADLVAVRELDWSRVTAELAAAAAGALRGRLVQILAGRDWRRLRPHHPVRSPAPRSEVIAVGTWVRVVGAVPSAPGCWGRVGRVERVYWWSDHRGPAPEWRARVCFAKHRRRRPGATIAYGLPLAVLQPATAPTCLPG